MNERERKELFRQFDLELCELCKLGGSLERIRYLISAGADIFCFRNKPLALAAKHGHFAVMELLIDAGVLKDERAVRIIASVCDHKHFDERAEKKFFALLERAIAACGGADIDFFAPYINSMLVHGKIDKLFEFMTRFYLGERQTAALVYPRMIFETIQKGYLDSLEFINENCDWITPANLDTAVSSGEIAAVKYMLQNSDIGLPSVQAILAAIFDGSTEILELLAERGFEPKSNPAYLKKACAAFAVGRPSALLFLLDHGYTLNDKYDGKTIKQNAEKDKNEPLLRFLESRQA